MPRMWLFTVAILPLKFRFRVFHRWHLNLIRLGSLFCDSTSDFLSKRRRHPRYPESLSNRYWNSLILLYSWGRVLWLPGFCGEGWRVYSSCLGLTETSISDLVELFQGLV